MCAHAHVLKPVCMHVCVYLVEFYFCKIPFQLFSRIHLHLPVKLWLHHYNPGHSELGAPLRFLSRILKAEIVEGRAGDADYTSIS